MARPPISVTIIALNEEDKIAKAIRSAAWADEVLLVDSGSTDKTVEIARKEGARVVYNAWPGYGQQKNFAQRQAAHDWVLNIDADEEIPSDLAREIQGHLDEIGAGRSQARGFELPRKTFYLGRWIKHGGWYPNFITRLADRRYASWTEPSVHEVLRIDGETQRLNGALLHYAFSSIQEQILTNVRFSHLGSQDLRRTGQGPSLLKLVLKPMGKFFETYFIKRGFMDGLPGFVISVNAAHSMFLKYAYLLETRIRGKA